MLRYLSVISKPKERNESNNDNVNDNCLGTAQPPDNPLKLKDRRSNDNDSSCSQCQPTARSGMYKIMVDSSTFTWKFAPISLI